MDLISRKQYEKELAEKQQTLEAVIKTAVDGIIIIDEWGRIKIINEATTQLFGYSSEDLLGQNISLLMPEPHRSKHDDYIARFQKSGKARIIGIGREVVGRRKDGSTFPFRLAVSQVKFPGKVLFTGVIHDLSDQKAAEAKILKLNKELESKVEERTEKLTEVVNKLLQVNLKLEHEIKERKAIAEALIKSEADLLTALAKEKELSELKSRFVSMASHEFRTPLTTIASSTELIGLYNKTEQQNKREKHLQRIKAAVTNLTGILGDFLSLSKLEEGKIQTFSEWFLLPELCKEVEEQIQGLLKPDQKIAQQFTNCTQQVYLDKNLLKNVMINLLSNAVKYSPAGSTIWFSGQLQGDELLVKIRDEGIGIPEEDQKHLFTRFFRAHNATNIQGTGLGLNIVKRYVELMHGKVSVDSKENGGATFFVQLPLSGPGS